MTAAAQALRALAEDRNERAFSAKVPPLTAAQARVESDRCLFCVDAPCTQACPADIDVPGFIRRIATGNVTGAAKTILSQNVLGMSCGTVCPVEVLCEGACVLNHEDRPPIRIGALQHFAVERTLASRGFPLTPKKAAHPKRVAVIGAGPGGIAAAAELKLLGHTPVVFEARAYPGGLNTYGVAPYKLSATQALEEFGYLEALGIEVRLSTAVGRDVRGAELQRDFDAVVVACGLGADTILPIPGAELTGSIGATVFIEQLKLGQVHLEDVNTAVVVGGGNTALDCVQELKKLGIKHVMMAIRRSEENLSGYAHEWAAARALGVQLIERVQPAKLHGEKKVSAIAFSTEHNAVVIDCELVVWAVGQSKHYAIAEEFPGLIVSGGRIAVDAEMRSGAAKVWACGDATNGGKEVVNAAAEAKRAARAIDRS